MRGAAPDSQDVMMHDGTYGPDNRHVMTPCPSDYAWSRKLQSCYKLVPRRVTWSAARERCRAEGADLVAIESDREQRYLNDAANGQRGALDRCSLLYTAVCTQRHVSTLYL